MPVDITGLTGHRMVPELFTAQAAATPDAVAIQQWEAQLSYADLLARAAGLAARLRSRGVQPGTRVGICVRRTPDVVAAMLGVLLAGGAYVPLDPAHPVRRPGAGSCRQPRGNLVRGAAGRVRPATAAPDRPARPARRHPVRGPGR